MFTLPTAALHIGLQKAKLVVYKSTAVSPSVYGPDNRHPMGVSGPYSLLSSTLLTFYGLGDAGSGSDYHAFCPSITGWIRKWKKENVIKKINYQPE